MMKRERLAAPQEAEKIRKGRGRGRNAGLLLGKAVFLLSLLFLVGCGTPPATEVILADFCTRYGADLPPGNLYHTEAELWEDGYLSKELLQSLYLEGEIEEIPLCGSIFLGSDREIPKEAAVFHCQTREEVERVSALCLARLRMLCRYAPTAESLIGARVEVVGNTVFYTVLLDNQRAMEILKDAISS